MIANFMFLGIGLAGAKILSRITLVPRTFLWPAVFVFSLIGSYSYGASVFDVWVILAAGSAGFLMLRHGFGPAPLVMGLILGKLVEESFSQSMNLLDNQRWRLFESPVVDFFFVLTMLGLCCPFISSWLDRRKQAAAMATDPVGD